MIYGYIRVSSDKQTVENQRFEIERFCKVKSLLPFNPPSSFAPNQDSGTMDKVHISSAILFISTHSGRVT